MKIVAIETSNFKGLNGYREFPDLPDGIIGVVGDNGKGKSTLMSAVAYAFYGPEVLDTGNADVVTWGQKEAWVTVWFWMDAPYMLHRSTDGKNTKAKLERDGEPMAQSATEVTSVMTDLLGIDRVGFLASVFSRQEDLLGIGSLQPAKRQSTVLRLLQFDRIERALKNISESNRDLNKEVSMLRAMGVEPVKGVNPDDIKDCEDKLKHLYAEREDISTAVDVLAVQVRKQERKITQYNEYAGKRNALEGELKAAREEMSRAFKENEAPLPPAPVKPDPWIEPQDYLMQERDLAELRLSLKRSICPTCKRPFDSDGGEATKKRVAETEEWLREHKVIHDNVKRYLDNQATYERMVDRKIEAQNRLEKVQGLVMDKMDALDALIPVENPMPAWERANKAFKDKDAELNRTNVLISSVETSLTHMRTALARQEEDAKRYSANQAEIKRVEHDIVVNGQTSLLMGQYKNNLIASVIPTITERASSLITEMTEGKYTELALTPQYDIEYRNENGDLKSFANLSGGEKDVFALALRLAIADLKAGSIGILVLDEVLESLDPGRQEATWSALERLTNRYNQVFVITHVDTFKDRAPHTIAV